VGEFLLVPAYPGSPRPRVVKRLCVCVCVSLSCFQINVIPFEIGPFSGM